MYQGQATFLLIHEFLGIVPVGVGTVGVQNVVLPYFIVTSDLLIRSWYYLTIAIILMTIVAIAIFGVVLKLQTLSRFFV